MSLLVGALALPFLDGCFAWLLPSRKGCWRPPSQRFSPESVETGILKLKTALKTEKSLDESNLPHFMSLEAPTRRWHRLGTSGYFLKQLDQVLASTFRSVISTETYSSLSKARQKQEGCLLPASHQLRSDDGRVCLLQKLTGVELTAKSELSGIYIPSDQHSRFRATFKSLSRVQPHSGNHKRGSLKAFCADGFRNLNNSASLGLTPGRLPLADRLSVTATQNPLS